MSTNDADRPSRDQAAIGWPRAIGTALLVVAAAFAATVWLPDLLLHGLASMSRDRRALVATALAVIATIAATWAMRRLQARGLV